MEIEFATGRLEDASLSLAQASRLFGMPMGRKYIQRIGVLRATTGLGELYGLRALRFHALNGDRAGQFAMTLTGNYRLVIERIADDRVRVLSVEDYHDN